ncbi:transcriptional regulator with XRE-family HTH domain [Paraburkholderia sp. UCT70]|uniref:helix-turn-helix domain-containing protein n=1 Tax=Paraburkholderia sp. UCT70 TaxID=2991068 RepID=UPI003D22DE74
MATAMEFGAYIRERREALLTSRTSPSRAPAYSLRGVARHLEIEASYLSKVERGVVSPPSDQTIRRLAEVLGEDVDTLMLLAGRVSPELQEIVGARPRVFAELIRELRDTPDNAILRLVREVRDGQW